MRELFNRVGVGVHACDVLEQRDGVHGVGQAAVLKHDADLGAQLGVCQEGVLAEQAHGTAGGLEQALGAGEGRSLTRTVRTEKNHHFAGEDTQIYPVDGAVVAACGESFGVLIAERSGGLELFNEVLDAQRRFFGDGEPARRGGGGCLL